MVLNFNGHKDIQLLWPASRFGKGLGYPRHIFKLPTPVLELEFLYHTKICQQIAQHYANVLSCLSMLNDNVVTML